MPRANRPKVSSPGAGGRTDLVQAPTAPTGMAYGEAGKLKAAQAAVPLPGPTPGTAPQRPDFAAVLAAAQGANGESIGLHSPSARPDEDVTAGLTRGPGPGPEPGMNRPGDDPTVAELRAIFLRFPNPDLLELIELSEQGVTF